MWCLQHSDARGKLQGHGATKHQQQYSGDQGNASQHRLYRSLLRLCLRSRLSSCIPMITTEGCNELCAVTHCPGHHCYSCWWFVALWTCCHCEQCATVFAPLWNQWAVDDGSLFGYPCSTFETYSHTHKVSHFQDRRSEAPYHHSLSFIKLRQLFPFWQQALYWPKASPHVVYIYCSVNCTCDTGTHGSKLGVVIM